MQMTNSAITGDTAVMRQARGEQILAAAVALLLEHGYRRITMEDVAVRSGVGTGTIYLHWKSKQTLFETVLLRELVAIWGELVQLLNDDPANALLHRFLSHLLRAVQDRPLAQALFTRDSSLLGKLVQQSTILQTQPFGSSSALITTLRDLGLMRTDLPPAVQAYAFSAIWAGFSLVDPLLAGTDHTPIDLQIAALTLTIRRTFEPEYPPDTAILQAQIAPALQQFLSQTQAIFMQQIQARMLAVPNRDDQLR
ncbi:MAG TPA: helix-turn-helix domain-containing protein [Roseiflexaceae bacterium]|nr:helix-turn-helix domain-containing protein [Roseiflexaceae bacterium]